MHGDLQPQLRGSAAGCACGGELAQKAINAGTADELSFGKGEQTPSCGTRRLGFLPETAAPCRVGAFWNGVSAVEFRAAGVKVLTKFSPAKPEHRKSFLDGIKAQSN